MVRACIVPRCRSGALIPSHAFPKDSARSRKWQAVIRSPRLNGLTNEEITKCTVCYRHFPEESYITTMYRRRLKHDAIPSLNLPSDIDSDDPSDVSSNDKNPEDVFDSLQEKTQPVPNNLQAGDQPGPSNRQEDTKAHVDGSPTPALKSTLKNRKKKNLLGNTTKRAYSGQKARRMNELVIAKLKKTQNTEQRKTSSYKQRLKDAQKFCNSVYFQKLSKSFRRTQKLFSEMKQCRTKHAPNIELAKLCDNICRICPEYAHEYLRNLLNK